MEQDLTTWLTIDAFCQATGKGRRTIERLLAQQQLRTAFDKRQDGRKPVIVIDPAEVPKLKAETLRPVVQSAKSANAATLPRHDDMQALLHALQRLLVPLVPKLLLDEREAALYLGVPRAEIQRLTARNVIPSFRLTGGQRRIRRVDLDTFAATPPQLQVAWRGDGIRNGERMTE